MDSHIQPQTHLPPRLGSVTAPISPNLILRLHILIRHTHTQAKTSLSGDFNLTSSV